MDFTKKHTQSDLLGIISSGLCTIHCIITPLFFASKPMIDGLSHAHGHGLFGFLDYLFLGLSFLAVWYSSKHSTSSIIKKILWLAWCVFAFGLLSEAFHLPYSDGFIYTGSVMLIVAHIQNYRHCLKCQVDGTSNE